jgi:hypothetical protein
MLTLTRLLSWLKALTCSDLGLLALVGRWSHQAMCPLQKELWLDGCLRVEPRRVGIALTEGLCDTREGGGGIIFWRKASIEISTRLTVHIPVPFITQCELPWRVEIEKCLQLLGQDDTDWYMRAQPLGWRNQTGGLAAVASACQNIELVWVRDYLKHFSSLLNVLLKLLQF